MNEKHVITIVDDRVLLNGSQIGDISYNPHKRQIYTRKERETYKLKSPLAWTINTALVQQLDSNAIIYYKTDEFDYLCDKSEILSNCESRTFKNGETKIVIPMNYWKINEK